LQASNRVVTLHIVYCNLVSQISTNHHEKHISVRVTTVLTKDWFLMRILNVNSTLNLKTGGGTAERTFQMSRHLAMRGAITTVLTLDIELNESRKLDIAPARVVSLPCLYKRFYIPLGGWRVIRRLVNEADVIHLMGHWPILNLLVYVAARFAKKPYVVCPAGGLPLFGRSRLFKRLYNSLVGNAIIKNASAWIAVTEGEFPHYESYGIASSQVKVIPNGVNEKDFPVTEKSRFLVRFGLSNVPFILFMGRLNPIKGPDILLRAYINAQASIPRYHLVFAGPDGGMLKSLIQEVVQAGLSDYVHFIGYVDGDDKLAAYQHAQLLVVPSRQEAMSIVALEAGVCGTPVLLTDQCGFSEVRLVDPRMEVPATIAGVTSGLINLLANDAVLSQIVAVWKNFVVQRYSWNVVIDEYINIYEKIIQLKKNDPSER
jgi:glycosyltransferase involved in cell wall biosynthesis